jgi:hypothetical protein
MRVLRCGSDNLSMRLSCITRSLWLRTVTHRSVGPTGLYIYYAPLSVDYSLTSSFDEFGSSRVLYFWSILFIIIQYFIWFSNLIERLGLIWLSTFSVGGHTRVWILLHFIILFYLSGLFEITVCPKCFLFGPWLVQWGSHLLLY